MNVLEKVRDTKKYLVSKMDQSPTIGLVLGSGLGVLADEIEQPVIIPYDEIPHFPVSTVTGHAGQLVIGRLRGKVVIAMQGRFHYYEGHSIEAVTYPIRIMKAIGVEQLIVTNAAGGINNEFEAGDLMLIQDHLNLTGKNPLIGPNLDEFGPRFPDMTEAYSKSLQSLAKSVAVEHGVNLVEGVYAGMLGPSYETPAEIRFLNTIGASAVGMSTVPEVITARHSGIEVLGISCISNLAAGISPNVLTHDEVMETTEKSKKQFLKLIKEIIAAM